MKQPLRVRANLLLGLVALLAVAFAGGVSYELGLHLDSVKGQSSGSSASPAASSAPGQALVSNAPCETSVSPLYCVYTVQAGDTLGAIAARLGLKDGDVPAAELLAQSNRPAVTMDELSVGQKLRVPSRQGVIHSIAAGESYESIADEYDVQLRDILNVDINRITDRTRVTVGQDILVPDPKTFPN